MSVDTTVATPDKLEKKVKQVLRAWFPQPEFRANAQFNITWLAVQANVLHVASNIVCSMAIEESVMTKAAWGWDEHIVQVLEGLAEKVHHSAALRGYGDPMHFEYGQNLDHAENILALLQIAQMELCMREAQGLGKKYYLVRRNKIAVPMELDALDRPLEWWQSFVSKVIAHAYECPHVVNTSSRGGDSVYPVALGYGVGRQSTV